MNANKLDELRHDDSKVVALVILAQSGDRAALGQVFEMFRPMVNAVALRALRNECEAHDLAQEVFLCVMKKIGQLREPERFAGWLRQIVFNMAINWKRKDRPLSGGGCGDDLLAQTAADDPDVGAELIGDEKLALLRRNLDRLKAVDRDTLVAHYLNGKSVKEMADEFAVPLGTIKRRLHVARERLAELMAE